MAATSSPAARGARRTFGLLLAAPLLLAPRAAAMVHAPPALHGAHTTTGAAASKPATLTIVRHGQSEYNLANRFTGWIDADLTARGIAEAREAGRLLSAEGVQLDLVCTSVLRRAVRTSCLILSGLDQCWVPMLKDARLNEQHSGALMGRNKRQLAEEHGIEQVMRWRRAYDVPPPPAGEVRLQRAIVADERYTSSGVVVPDGESLRDTHTRVLHFWREILAPALSSGQNVMVVSHGNTLRALVKVVESVSAADSFNLDLPTACPLIYSFGAGAFGDLGAEPAEFAEVHGVWGASGVPRRGRYLMDVGRVESLQRAMRAQVERNIAVSTINLHPADHEIATCDAWAADSQSSERISLGDGDDLTYNVRTLASPIDAAPTDASPTVAPAGEGPHYEAAPLSRGVHDWGGADSAALSEKATEELQLFFGQQGGGSRAPPTRRVAANLILLRHGYSVYNEQNRFTGWADTELARRGRDEARLVGSVLRAMGVRRIEKVFCSMLKRSIKTAWLMLDEMEMQWVPLSYTWRLNERHYGALQGVNKRECSEQYGLRQVQRWRRGVHDEPPRLSHAAAEAEADRRYADIDVPAAESLEACCARVSPFLRGELRDAMREAVHSRGSIHDDVPNFVISSSENLIRAIVRELDELSDAETPLVNIPHATPLIYQLDADLEPIPSRLANAPLRHGWYVADPDRVTEAQRMIRDEVDCRLSDSPCEVREIVPRYAEIPPPDADVETRHVTATCQVDEDECIEDFDDGAPGDTPVWTCEE